MQQIIIRDQNFELDEKSLILDSEGFIPLVFWPVTPNFGDLLSPWLFEKMTGKPVKLIKSNVRKCWHLSTLEKFERKALRSKHYVSIGSVISRARNSSIVWGTGAFGTEQFCQLSYKAEYRAVRGPLTRQLLKNAGITVPEIYGDPALLVQNYYTTRPEKRYKIGVVLRWSEGKWITKKYGKDIKIINLGSADVDNTLFDILSCDRIITSSLHGLIIADSFGIPNAFLSSETPKGGLFKYFDYFASVNKFRLPKLFNFDPDIIEIEHLEAAFEFDDRPISFDYQHLLSACPFLRKVI